MTAFRLSKLGNARVHLSLIGSWQKCSSAVMPDHLGEKVEKLNTWFMLQEVLFSSLWTIIGPEVGVSFQRVNEMLPFIQHHLRERSVRRINKKKHQYICLWGALELWPSTKILQHIQLRLQSIKNQCNANEWATPNVLFCSLSIIVRRWTSKSCLFLACMIRGLRDDLASATDKWLMWWICTSSAPVS